VRKSLEAGEKVLAHQTCFDCGPSGDGRAVGTIVVTDRGVHFVDHHLLVMMPTMAHRRFPYDEMVKWRTRRQDFADHVSFELPGPEREHLLVTRKLATVTEQQVKSRRSGTAD
jgi:hypothetical protein